MAYILLLDQVRRKRYSFSPNPPEDPDGKKAGWVFLILLSLLILILIAALVIG